MTEPTFNPNTGSEVADFLIRAAMQGDTMNQETKQHFTDLALNNAKCRGYSKWMYCENSKTQYFVIATKESDGVVVEYVKM